MGHGQAMADAERDKADPQRLTQARALPLSPPGPSSPLPARASSPSSRPLVNKGDLRHNPPTLLTKVGSQAAPPLTPPYPKLPKRR